ncbi:LADA_0F08372g1_1 [Lachancea dasiensis]|uniref:LADA_0F08372g1_1 n=1 Tax=Lachancea dasiensis TaxID=1072105 RepID=A0A1G4JL88_9SACH|nr:LADA_0F08372g1_1 [Lachancea dasiensis]
MSSEVVQLAQARALAMTTKPEEMLPKVLETALSLYQSTKGPSVELGRICARLFTDVLNHEEVPASEKPFIASQNLVALSQLCRSYQDHSIVRDSILAFSKCYDSLFDLVAKTSNKELWDTMCQLKEFILSKWKSVYPLTPSEDPLEDHGRSLGVKLATVRFMCTVIIVHTQGSTGISIASVPDSHPVIKSKTQLESGAKKLLDYLLSYLSDEPMMVSSLFMGILNCLSFIMKQRPQATNRILNGILRFNVDNKYQQNSESALHYRLAKRFVERCYKVFVQYGLKSQLIKNSGSSAQYHAKLSKISQTLHVIGEETKSKGILNFDTKQVERKMPPRDRSKFIALQKATASQQPVAKSEAQQPRLSPDMQILHELQKYAMSKSSTSGFFNNSPVAIDNTYASVYSLMNSKHSEHDVSKLSPSVMAKVCTESLYQTDTNKIISGLSIVASRYTDLMNKASQSAVPRKRSQEDEPSGQHVAKKQEVAPLPEDDDVSEEEDKQEFTLGLPTPMSSDEKEAHFSRVLAHIMSVRNLEEEASTHDETHDNILHKVRLLRWDNKTSWLTLLIRLATRGVSRNAEMSNKARNTIYEFFLEDFGSRIDVVIEWLSEEWYYESLENKSSPVYDEWSLKVLDALIPVLEPSHRRQFIRLVSEVPRLTQHHIDRIKSLCLDPLRSSLGFQSLKFMIMFRPPVKAFIENILRAMLDEDETVKEQCESILAKFY